MKDRQKDNIILIGMPGSGKSTIGPRLANMLDMDFLDTDEIIREKEGMELKDIVNRFGHERFLEIQETAALNINVRRCVIATGGSIVYSDAAMRHFKDTGKVVYLKVRFEDVTQRLASGRRFARRRDQSLHDVYNERVCLYERYADIGIDCTGKDINAVLDEIVEKCV